MVQFDNQYRQIKVKIVYYGPALGGKTTCLQYIHRATDPQQRTRLYSLNTASDRTLFFDLLSLNLGRIRGYRLAIQLYTVPGQVQYNATRRAVLAGADGIVFVADSQPDEREANLHSLQNLRENLDANGLDPETVPMIIQYNKRDLEGVRPVDDLDVDLNRRGVSAFSTIAITGEGVLEAFAAITEATLAAVTDKLGVGGDASAVDRLRQQVRSALEPFVSASGLAAAADDVQVTVPDGAPDESGPLPQETLVSEAVRANMAMTDLNTRLETVSRQLERKAKITSAITDFGRTIANERDPADVLRMLAKTAVAQLRVQAAAVLIVRATDQLQEAVVHGLERDPLLAAEDGDTTLAGGIARARESLLVARDLAGGTDSMTQLTVEGAGFASAIAVPLTAHDRLLGMLTVYGGIGRKPLDDDDLELATILGASAAMGYANALAFSQLEDVNVGLESTVDQKTAEQIATLEEIRHLNHELERLDKVKSELITRMADQLQSPVASLVTATQVLDRYRDAQSDKTTRFLDIIRVEADKLSEAIESIVQASHLVTDPGDVERREHSLEDLLRRVISPLRDLAGKRQVEFRVLIPSGLESVSCVEDDVGTALRAVAKNAVEFNRQGGEVRIEVRRVRRGDDPWVEFKISDTGDGISEADLERVFETFWQGTPGQSGEHRGVGLGLAIAKQVVERHGGEISILSRPTEGTEVSIELPQ
jgi:signal transduction histidine kinase/signal recognition particle receptor subunit beta